VAHGEELDVNSAIRVQTDVLEAAQMPADQTPQPTARGIGLDRYTCMKLSNACALCRLARPGRNQALDGFDAGVGIASWH